MLHAGAAVEVDVLLNLGLLLALSRFVDGEFDPAVAVAHHLGHQSGVVRGNVLIVKRDELGEAHDAGVKLGPLVHLAPIHVAHHVVDEFQANGGGLVFAVERFVAGQEGARIIFALHKNVHGVPVGFDAAEDGGAVLVGNLVGLKSTFCAALGGLLPALAGVVYPEGNVLDAVAVQTQVVVQGRFRGHGGGDHQGDFVLPQHIGGAVLHAGLQAAVGQVLKPEGGFVEMGHLLGVADDKFDVVGAVEGEEIFHEGSS